MAYITASPNPVGVYSATWGAWARFEWNVQDGPNEVRAAEVRLSVNGGPSQPIQGPGFYGIWVHRLTLPNNYEFILRYADTKSELTRVEVQTFDLRTELATGFASSGLAPPASQARESSRLDLPGHGSLAVANGAGGAEFVFETVEGSASRALPSLAWDGAIQLVAATILEWRPDRSAGRDLIVEALDRAGRLWAFVWPDFPNGAPADRWTADDGLPVRLDERPEGRPRA